MAEKLCKLKKKGSKENPSWRINTIAQIVTSSSSAPTNAYVSMLYEPNYHNRMFYTHTGTTLYTTKLIDLESQTSTTYPHSSDYTGSSPYTITYSNSYCVKINNSHPGIVTGISFKEGDVDLIAEDIMPTTLSITLDCSGYKSALVNLGGNYAAGWGIAAYIDLTDGTVNEILTYGYAERLQITLSGSALTFAVISSSNRPYYSVLGIK